MQPFIPPDRFTANGPPLLSRAPAAVDKEVGSGDEGGFVAGEIESGRGDLVGFGHASERLGGGHFLIGFFGVGIFFETGGDEGGFDPSGADAIDADALFGVVEGHAFGEAHDGEFSGAVRDAVADADHPADGSHINDVPGFLEEHAREKSFGDIEEAADIDLIKAVEIVAGGLHESANVADGGVVDQNIEAQFAGIDRLNGSLGIRFAADVEREKLRLAILGLDFRDDFPACFLIDVSEEHVSSGARKPFGNGRADARGRACDQGDLVIELKHSGDFQEFFLGPGIDAIFGFGPDLSDGIGIDRAGGVAPFPADISQDRGNLFIVEDAEAGHVEFPDFAFDHHGTAGALKDDPDEAFFGTEHPFGILERGSESILALSVRLVASSAYRGVKDSPLLERELLFGSQGSGCFFFGWFAGFAGPGHELIEFLEPRLDL
jgi:hypothetical protein